MTRVRCIKPSVGFENSGHRRSRPPDAAPALYPLDFENRGRCFRTKIRFGFAKPRNCLAQGGASYSRLSPCNGRSNPSLHTAAFGLERQFWRAIRDFNKVSIS